MVLSSNDLNDRSDGWGHEDNKEPMEDLIRPVTESPEERWARSKVERVNVKPEPEEVAVRLGLSEDEVDEVQAAEEDGENSVGEYINGKSDYTEGIYANQNGDTPDTELNAEHPETSTYNRKTIQSVPGDLEDRSSDDLVLSSAEGDTLEEQKGHFKEGDYAVKKGTKVTEVDAYTDPADVTSSGSSVAAAERTEDPGEILEEASDGDGEYTQNAVNNEDEKDDVTKYAGRSDEEPLDDEVEVPEEHRSYDN